jgi:proton translocating ATP synthase F1 alpha subunit
LNDV